MHIGELTNTLSRGIMGLGYIAIVCGSVYAVATTIHKPFQTPAARQFHSVRQELKYITSEQRILRPELEDTVAALTAQYLALRNEPSAKIATGKEDRNNIIIALGLFGGLATAGVGAAGAAATKKYR